MTGKRRGGITAALAALLGGGIVASGLLAFAFALFAVASEYIF